MVSDDTRFVEIYRARSAGDAHLARIRLEESEIPVLLENELLQGVAGELPFGWPIAPRLLVPEENVDAAREALKDLGADEEPYVSTLAPDADERTDQDECLACGHPLGDEAVCAECGWTFETQAAESDDSDDKDDGDLEPRPTSLLGEVLFLLFSPHRSKLF